jgi:Zn-finger nucleic acid-binding protein
MFHQEVFMKTSLYCPTDKNILDSVETEGHQHYSCRSCGGLWIEQQTLKRIYMDARSPFLPLSMHKLPGSMPHKESLLKCPNDRLPMITIAFMNVEVDACPSCHGFWLDRSKLSNILYKGNDVAGSAFLVDGVMEFLGSLAEALFGSS